MTERLVQLERVLLLGLCALLVRLADLQLVRGAQYRRLAEQNRLRLVSEQAPRGLIVDRQDWPLANNQLAFRVTLIPQELADPEPVLAHLSLVTHRSVEGLRQEYGRARSLPFVPAVVVSSAPKDVALRLEESRWRYPGLFIKHEASRQYPAGSSAAHLLGHLSEPTAEEYALLKEYGVRPKHLVGRMGLERLLDHALRGRAGGLVVEVDSQGRQVTVVGHRPPEPGARVTLTIDAPLQFLIEQAFGEQPGAAVVLDPRTGAVLAMVSVPAFSPGSFVGPSREEVARYLDDPASPLLNRATIGAYPPGSTAKLVTAGAALEHKLITPSTTVVCRGSVTIGDRTIHCWNREGHGALDLTGALMQSCNVYFIHAGRRLGADRLRAAFERMGFGRRTGWPLDEQSGHLPRRRLTPGEVAFFAIGQGETLVTVLQSAVMAAAFANGGTLVEPWVVDAIAGRPVSHRPASRRLGWSDETMQAIQAGMRAVVHHPDGTAHRAYTPSVTIAGKTGTAQTHVPDRPHGWFVGYCPIEAPRAAMAILTEHGGSGGDLPADMARAICEYVASPGTLGAPP